MNGQQPPGQEISVKQQVQSLQQLLDERKGTLQQLMPKHMSPDRAIKCALSAISRNPLLLKCTRESWVMALMSAAQAGLDPGVPRGGMHLVPFWNKKLNQNKGGYEVVAIPDYRGLMSMVRRTRTVKGFYAKEVYEADYFDVQFGDTPKLVHRPYFGEEQDRGKIVAFYSICFFAGGGSQFEVMQKFEVDAVRARSKAQNGPAWIDDYPSMGRKTVIRKHCNYLDLSPEIWDVLQTEDALERDESPYDIDIFEDKPVRSRVADIKERLKSVSAAPAAEEPAAEPDWQEEEPDSA